MKTKIRVTATSDDLRKAMFLNMKPRPSFMILGGVVGALWIVVWAFMTRDYFTNGTYAFPLAILTFCSFYMILSPLVYFPWRAKKTFAQQKMLHDEITYELDDNGLSAYSKWGTSQIPWSTFLKVKSNKDLMLLYHSDHLFTMIPRRAFENDSDFTAATSDIVNKLGKK